MPMNENIDDNEPAADQSRGDGFDTSWYSKPIGDGMMSTLFENTLEEVFRQYFRASEPPADAAIFVSHRLARGLHCEVTAWFSPALRPVALDQGAQPSRSPAPGDLRLVAGSESCWSVLFPDLA